MSLFDALPEAEQVRLLESALKDEGEDTRSLQQLVRDWGLGRADKVAAELKATDADSPALYKMLMVDRNRRWADWIADGVHGGRRRAPRGARQRPEFPSCKGHRRDPPAPPARHSARRVAVICSPP